MTAVLGGAHPFSPDVPSKGPRCNSNISAIRFEGLNCQERMMAATGRLGCKRQTRLLSEVRSTARWSDGPRYHAAVATVCRIREKLNANGDGSWICCLGASFRRRGPRRC